MTSKELTRSQRSRRRKYLRADSQAHSLDSLALEHHDHCADSLARDHPDPCAVASCSQVHVGSSITWYSVSCAIRRHAFHRGRRCQVPELEKHVLAIAKTEDTLMKILVALHLPCSLPRSPLFVMKVLCMGGVPGREAAFALLRLLRMNLVRVSVMDCKINESEMKQTMCFEADSSEDEGGDCVTCTLDVMKFMADNTMGGLPVDVIIKGVTDNYKFNKENVSEALSICEQLSIVGKNHFDNYLLV